MLPATTAQIRVLEANLLAMPQADIITSHSFSAGVYERTIKIPPKTLLTGAVHKTPYRVRLERGSIAVNIGSEVKILTAPFSFDASAGEKRVGLTLDEVVWTDIYDNPDNCRDLALLEGRLYHLEDGEELGETRKLRLALAGGPVSILEVH